MKNEKRTPIFFSLQLQLLAGFTLLFTIVFTGAYYWFYTYATSMTIGRIEKDVLYTLQGAINGVDVEQFVALANEGEVRADGYSDDPRYWEHINWLVTVQEIEPRAEIYTYVAGNEPSQVIFIGSTGAVTNPPWGAKFKEPYISTGRGQANLLTGLVSIGSKTDIYADKWGTWMSAWGPIKNDKGEVVGAMGLDFRADYVLEVQNGIRNNMLAAFTITYVILLSLLYTVSLFFTRPIVALTKVAEQIGNGDYEQKFFELKKGRFRNELISLTEVFELMTEKVRQREQTQEAVYENLVEHSAQGLALIQIQTGQIIKANKAFARICGLTLPELYAIDVKKLRERVHPDDITTMLHYIEKRFTGATSKYHEMRLLLENGETRWLEFMPLWFNFMGQPALQLTVIDQTERKSTELALAESVEQLKKLEISLRDAKEALEIRVADRTADLNKSREQLRELTHQIVNALEGERRRVSRELHDEAGQILIGLKYRLGEALSSLPLDYQEARQLITTAMDGTDQAMQKIRALAHALRPPTLDVAGINLSLQSLCREFSEQVSLPITYKGIELVGLGDEINISLYRILQEALTNIVKHAPQATHVNVTLARTKKRVALTIEDNGQGFHPDPAKKGIGILGIQERLALLGGRLEILQGARGGTRLKAIIPTRAGFDIQEHDK
ncbi:MAG: PAS domain S-box protein [Bacteroidetes bacterium]|nr:PAS domain S-box protein [Bacteroidota bacterium]